MGNQTCLVGYKPLSGTFNIYVAMVLIFVIQKKKKKNKYIIYILNLMLS